MTDKSDERKAVPREPTDEMLKAVRYYFETPRIKAEIWRAMFDAAPALATAPAGQINDAGEAKAGNQAGTASRPVLKDASPTYRGVASASLPNILASSASPNAAPAGEPQVHHPDDAATGLRFFAINYRRECADMECTDEGIEEVERAANFIEQQATELRRLRSAPPAGEVAALIERLRTEARSIERKGIDGWGNLMTEAAEALARLSAPVPRQVAEPFVWHCKRALHTAWVWDEDSAKRAERDDPKWTVTPLYVRLP